MHRGGDNMGKFFSAVIAVATCANALLKLFSNNNK